MEKEYYYNIDIGCHEYFRGGIIEQNVELYSNADTLNQDVEDYIINEYENGEEFLENATEYGPLEIKINFTDDPNQK